MGLYNNASDENAEVFETILINGLKYIGGKVGEKIEDQADGQAKNQALSFGSASGMKCSRDMYIENVDITDSSNIWRNTKVCITKVCFSDRDVVVRNS